MLEDNEDKLESTSEPNIYAKISLADKQGEDRGCRQLKTSTTCLLHSTGVRNTEDCPLFLRGTVKDRSAIVREKKAYFNCPMTGHTARNCRNKVACPRKDCAKNHQKLLHDEFWEKRQNMVKLSVNCYYVVNPYPSMIPLFYRNFAFTLESKLCGTRLPIFLSF